MKLKQLFTINLFIAVFFGITCTFFADWVGKLYGVQPNEAALWTTRLAGGSILGFASLMWFGRKTESQSARRAIAQALLIQDTVGLAASLLIQLGGGINSFGWSNPVIYGVLAMAYAWFLFFKPQNI